MDKLISVIIPVYKVEAFLDKCVESVVNQSYTNLEIILVDDGSPDNCPKMCDEWAKKDKRIKVIHKPNGGLSDARNAGMKVASGEYIAFLDSDDWVDSDFYKVLIEQIIKYDCEIVAGKYQLVTNRNSCVTNSTNISVEVLNSYNAMDELIKDKKVRQVVWNKLYNRKSIEGILFEYGKCHEDEFWSYQVIGKINKIAIVDYIGYFYYQRPDSIMGIAFNIKRLDALEAKSNRQLYLKEKYPSLYDKGLISLRFLCMYYGQQAFISMNKKDAKSITRIIKKYVSKYRVSLRNIKDQSFGNTFWLLLSQICFNFSCKVRNFLRIGL